MTASFVVYIDESGDEGFVFEVDGGGKGSSRWFVLSGVVIEKQHDIETTKLIGAVKKLIGRKDDAQDTLHFRKLAHQHRVPLIDAISKASLKTITVMIHKPSLVNVELFQTRNALYNYASRLLLERVSWYCRDHKTPHTQGDGSAEIMFSNRAGMSYDEFKNYLRHLQQNSDDIRIDWRVIKVDQIQSHSVKLRGMQIADAVASGFFYGVELNQYGFCEPRYATMLKSTVYQNRSRYVGYGFKFFPRETDGLIKQSTHLSWLFEVYNYS